VGIRWGATEIASRVFVTVRDADWRTVPARVRRLDVDDRADGFTIDVEAEHDDGAVGFAWRGRFVAGAEGTLACSFAGSATRDFGYRRIGICVLHPWANHVGARWSASGGEHTTEGVIDREIAPQLMVGGVLQPMIPAFTSLVLRLANGVEVSWKLQGERFELEDQRNWSDASFKTYPTPLARSHPRVLRAGEEIGQRCAMTATGPVWSAGSGARSVLRIGDPTGTRMPDLGITAPNAGSSDATIAALRAIGPSHVRVEVVPSRDDEATSRAALDAAAAIGAPLEVAVLVDGTRPDDAGSDLDAAVVRLRGRELARALVHRLDGRTTPTPVIEGARARLAPGVSLVGGTASHFSELNRDRPERAGIDAVGVAITPQVHATDERSIVETLEVQAQIVAQLRRMTGGLPVVVSPVTLAARTPADPQGHHDIDPRTRSPFAGPWTAASVACLATAGAVSMTFHERANDTLAELDAASGLTPAGLALASLAAFRGREVVRVGSSHPRLFSGMAARTGDTTDTIVANLTAEPIGFDLEAGGSTMRVELGGCEVKRFEVRGGRISEVPLWSLPHSADPSR
jgi:hypothetical protein